MDFFEILGHSIFWQQVMRLCGGEIYFLLLQWCCMAFEMSHCFCWSPAFDRHSRSQITQWVSHNNLDGLDMSVSTHSLMSFRCSLSEAHGQSCWTLIIARKPCIFISSGWRVQWKGWQAVCILWKKSFVTAMFALRFVQDFSSLRLTSSTALLVIKRTS